jgi:EAL domain-containing protein (putative c-di-GMP-specific phosphodiesterase class I)
VFETNVLGVTSDAWQQHLSREVAYLLVGLAVESGQIQVCYQPIWNLQSGELSGFEVFADIDGLVDFPADDNSQIFWELTRNGQLENLWRQLLERSCRDLQVWNQILGHSQLRVSINMMPNQVTCDNAKLAAEIVTKFDIWPGQISFEITEQPVVPGRSQPAALNAQALRTLVKAGFVLTMDDLPAGDNSLERLADFSCWQAVKLDKSLTGKAKDQLTHQQLTRCLIHTVLTIRPELKAVTAEGIETGSQLQILKKLGCTHGQGYYLGGKMSFDNISLALFWGKILAQTSRSA